jgi:hypothetical protein
MKTALENREMRRVVVVLLATYLALACSSNGGADEQGAVSSGQNTQGADASDTLLGDTFLDDDDVPTAETDGGRAGAPDTTIVEEVSPEGDTDAEGSAEGEEGTTDAIVVPDIAEQLDVVEPSPEELDRLYGNPEASSAQPCYCYPYGGDCDASMSGTGHAFDPERVCPEGELCNGGYPSGTGGCLQECTTSPDFEYDINNPSRKAQEDSCPEGWVCVAELVMAPDDEVWAKFWACIPQNPSQYKRWKSSKQRP